MTGAKGLPMIHGTALVTMEMKHNGPAEPVFLMFFMKFIDDYSYNWFHVHEDISALFSFDHLRLQWSP